MSEIVNNPAEVLLTLDGQLDHPVSLVIYGRAALCLGFDGIREVYFKTEDVDGIIRMSQLDGLVNDELFWDAIEETNRILDDKGLYITHLFQEDQVFLRPEWESHLVAITRPPTKWLTLFRPHAIDLVLTKMMRGADEQDMEDVEFLVRHDALTSEQMEPAFATVRMPDVIELRDAFQKALPIVRDILQRVAGEG
jgi:hypothetical protein